MSWVGPGTAATTRAPSESKTEDDASVYRALVVDSGPIIRHAGMSSLFGRAKAYYTVPAVMQEIRDAKARQHLDRLPFTLQEKEPSAEAVNAIIAFARQTGDYQSLSSVDIQVLALLWDLEREGCAGNMGHLRTTPKRKLGVGKIESLGKVTPSEKMVEGETKSPDDVLPTIDQGEAFFEGADVDYSDDDESDDGLDKSPEQTPSVKEKTAVPTNGAPAKPKSWATLVNPSVASAELPKVSAMNTASSTQNTNALFGQMKLIPDNNPGDGQFSDADDDETGPIIPMTQKEVEAELKTAFPSLGASATVPYEGSDNEEDTKEEDEVKEDVGTAVVSHEELEARKKESLKQVSKSGKAYNSFRRYGNLMKPKPAKSTVQQKAVEDDEQKQAKAVADEPTKPRDTQSRIIGGMGFAGQEDEVEDDGEGWITSTADINSMKSSGILDPSRKPGDKGAKSNAPEGPPMSMRTACTTTDFAMQNVILQMNFELVSVDGIKIRRLKTWVSRCGACFKIYADGNGEGPAGMKRLFCSHCGSDIMQRIAASVDGKTGRLRLHMRKNYQHNLRGTKFSLPKAGSGNRFQGDLLLREDQLLTGAWNQKVKIRSGGKARASAQSIFGRDLATSVGCNSQAVTSDDIRVGFGRRNPNSSKGRERRGKKKKSSDKACGLRRY